MIAEYIYKVAYLVVPNYLAEHVFRNLGPLFEILVVGHSLAPVLVKKDGANKLPDNRELAPVNQFWMVRVEILITTMSTNEVGCMSFEVRDCGTSGMLQCKAVCLTHAAGTDQ